MTRGGVALMCLISMLASTPVGAAADRVSDGQWFHAFLKTSEAWTVVQGADVVVAVIDSGVDADHPDLSGSVLPGIDLTKSGDGREDTHGHGTAMAGLVAAHGLVAGIAPKARVLPIRYNQANEGGGLDLLAQGIKWAVANKVRVISISQGSAEDDLLLRQQVEAAIMADIVVVAGVGNTPKQTAVAFPAAIPGVLAVGGVDRNGNHSSVSVTGPEVVISAPSDNISSTDRGGGYREGTGTSDATAIVAGAVALVRAKYPDMKATEVVRRLTATAVDKGAPGRDSEYGYGVLNLVGALTADLPAATTALATTGGATPAAPPSRSSGFPWWLLAVPAAIVLGLWGFVTARRRR